MSGPVSASTHRGGSWVVLGVLLGALLLAGVWGVSIHNELVALDEHRHTAWAQVQTVLQRRYDLIPNLVNTVKGYAAHERELFEEVTRLRSQWAAAAGVDAQVRAAGELERVLGRLLLVAERYPDLKANQNFLDLQRELAGTENRITVERQRYNEAVRAYNTRVRQFPANLIAGWRGFAPSDAYFEAETPAQTPPTVNFGS